MAYSSHNMNDTIVALATPAGVGAIGVVRLSGGNAITIVNGVFYGKNLEKVASHTIHFGTIRHQDRIIDEVLVSVFKSPTSYTKEDAIEISCHGSPYILQEVIQVLIQNGARMANAGEFTMRAFLNGQLDLSQAEAVADLIHSDSAQSHQLAMQQMRGGFSEEIRKLRDQLIHFASLIELELDFGEEDVEFANREDLKALIQKIQTLICQLIHSFQLGNVLKKGVNTVLAGRPNAGKSTLLNALLNEERAIVSDIAGTTRDTIEEILNIKGVQFRLIDTAGIRQAQDQIEAVGVQKTMEKIQQSALLLYVFDVLETKIDEALDDIRQLTADKNLHYLVICNKMDTNPYYKPEWLANPLDTEIPDFFFKTRPTKADAFVVDSERVVSISALHKMNIPYLKERLYESIIQQNIHPDQTIVTNARHYQALEKALQSLDAALQGMETGITSDFIAMDIRQALHYLGEITGEISTDDLLEKIFSSFCIGK